MLLVNFGFGNQELWDEVLTSFPMNWGTMFHRSIMGDTCISIYSYDLTTPVRSYKEPLKNDSKEIQYHEVDS